MKITKMPWFLPETPDVLGMLCRQAEVTERGMDALVSWAGGDAAAMEVIRRSEHEADDCKRDLRMALRDAFTTPIDAEDVYVLSSLLDEVLNSAKDAVRESEVMAVPPDEHVRGMAQLLAVGVQRLAEAFGRMNEDEKARDPQAVTDAADAAVKAQRQLERVYRRAMSSLLDVADLREVMGRRELYRRFSRISDLEVDVAERVWYALVKEA